jgi:hypothetical protein
MDGLGKVQTKHPFPYNSRRSFSMKPIFHVSLLLIIAFSFAACKPSKPSSQNVEPSQPVTVAQETAPGESNKHPQLLANPQSDQTKENNNEKSVYDLFVPKAQKSLSYNGYTIIKTSKKEVLDKEERVEDVSYSILKKGRRTIKRFEGLDAWLTASDFGLFSFLGGNSKQLIVAQTLPRSGRFWIVRLDPEFRILLDTDEYGNFREEPYIVDIDKDGSYEIIEAIWDFGGIGKAKRPMTTPQPVILFKYDRKADRYFPANQVTQGYTPGTIEEELQKLQTKIDPSNLISSEESYYAERASVLLKFIFAGREREGWKFFDHSYTLSDKGEVKAAIKAVLRKQPAYRFIYRKQTKNRA